jgi:hypothetical protein
MKLTTSTSFMIALLATSACLSAQSFVTTHAGSGAYGFVDGTITNCEFGNPLGSCLDKAGNLYVADQQNNAIRKIGTNNVVSTLAGNGSKGYANAQGTNATFSSPAAVAVDAATNVYVADYGNNVIRKITPAGVVSTLMQISSASSLNHPSGVAVDVYTNVYVADTDHNVIRVISPGGASTIYGTGTSGDVDGGLYTAQFCGPVGLALDASRNIYVAEALGSVIRKVTPLGIVSTLAGKSKNFSYVDGAGTNARFQFPTGIAVDAKTNIYIADLGNNVIRKIDTKGVVSTLAGTNTSGQGRLYGQSGFVDGQGSDAEFNQPQGVTVDPYGNLYIDDTGNQVIRYVQIPTKTQTIAKVTISGATYGKTYRFTAPTSTSKLPVGISILNGGLYFSDSNSLYFNGAGSASLEATQPGDGTYLPATPVRISFVVAQAKNAILNFGSQGPGQVRGSQTFSTLAATSLDYVTLSVLSGPGTIVQGTHTVTFTAKGTVVLQAVDSGNLDYPPVTAKLTITVKP